MMEEKYNPDNDHLEFEEKKSKGRRLAGTLFTLGLLIGAVIMVFVVVNNSLSARTTGTENWAGRGGSCCSVGGSLNTEEQLALSGLDYYRANFGDSEGLTAAVDDFGCHQEITILRNGEVVGKLGYSNDNFYNITP